MKRSFWIRLAALGFVALTLGTNAYSIQKPPLPPTYCTECRPCTKDTDCGYDANAGGLQGFCIPRSHFPCPAYTCICR